MGQRQVWTFFYGSYLNLDVLKEVDYIPARYEPARLFGFDITIRPLANLVPAEEGCVYGIVATGTHAELERLYAHATQILGGTYLPEAVLVQTFGGQWLPALCYIAPEITPGPADSAYIDRIVVAARKHGIPEGYLRRLECFRS